MKVEAPWTIEQADALNAWQACGWVHPFTCPNRDDGRHFDDSVLHADTTGWKCPFCKYIQTWAHDFMLNGPPPHPWPAIRSE